jgi:hypothetical protein
MLGLSAICWAIWKAKNKVCFEKKVLKNPLEIIISACALMCYWAGLYSESPQKMIKDGVNLMMKTAIRLIGSQAGDKPKLMNGTPEDATGGDEGMEHDAEG